LGARGASYKKTVIAVPPADPACGVACQPQGCRAMSRSFAIVIAVLAALFTGVATSEARSPRGPAISVDASPVGASLGAFLAQEMRAALARHVAPLLGPGERVHVRIRALQQASYGGLGGGGRIGDGGGDNDYMEGDVSVIGPRGEILRQFPMLVVLSASSGGAWYLEGNEQRRITAICNQFAAWTARKLR
jgi:hypothetical protein